MLKLEELNKENNEVYYTREKIISLDKEDINFLIEVAKKNPRQRVRLCCHSSIDKKVHEMVIVHPRNAYVRPHKHLNKTESMLVLFGELDYLVFDNKGKVVEVTEMSNSESNKTFFRSLRSDIFHTLLIKTEWLVFLEITEGPFARTDTIFAPWSPEDSNTEEVKDFLKDLHKTIRDIN